MTDPDADGPSTNRSSHVFTLADLMILVAATATGIAWTRIEASRIREMFSSTPPGVDMPLLLIVRYWLPAAVPCLTMWSVALLVALFRRQPRPSLPDLSRQPGPVACGMATLILVIQLAGFAASSVVRWVPGIGPGGPTPYSVWPVLSGNLLLAGYAVAGIWLVLAFGRRWRHEPCWIDRSGRFLGVCWIAISLIKTLDSYVWP